MGLSEREFILNYMNHSKEANTNFMQPLQVSWSYFNTLEMLNETFYYFFENVRNVYLGHYLLEIYLHP